MTIYEFKKIYSSVLVLVGSRAKGTHRPDSDWDFVLNPEYAESMVKDLRIRGVQVVCLQTPTAKASSTEEFAKMCNTYTVGWRYLIALEGVAAELYHGDGKVKTYGVKNKQGEVIKDIGELQTWEELKRA